VPSSGEEEVLFGSAITLSSANGTRLAVGAPMHDYSTPGASNSTLNENGGGVFLYEYDGTLWNLLWFLPGDLGEGLGESLSLSADGSRVAVRRFRYNPDSVEVYEIAPDGTGAQLGTTLSCGANGDTVTLSPDGSRVAVSCENFSGNTGRVEIFEWTGAWTSIGIIDGVSGGDFFGWSTAFSNDGNRLAVSAPNYDGTDGSLGNSGMVRIFDYAANQWTQVAELLGVSTLDQFGFAMDLSGDGQSFVASCPGRTTAVGDLAGEVKVYSEVDGSWTLLGEGISGVDSRDRFGRSVSIVDDGSRVAASSYVHNGSRGHVRVFDFDQGDWVEYTEISGDNAVDRFGFGRFSVSMTGDGTLLASGSTLFAETGRVRVFDLDGGTPVQSASPSAAPSPTQEPAASQVPSVAPSASETAAPTIGSSPPTDASSASPSAAGTTSPTPSPSLAPSAVPSASPSSATASAAPTPSPTLAPSAVPSASPSSATVSAAPTSELSLSPSGEPSAATTVAPSNGGLTPTSSPTLAPSAAPSSATVSPTLDTVLGKLDWNIELTNITTQFDEASIESEVEIEYRIHRRQSLARIFEADCTTAVPRSVIELDETRTPLSASEDILKLSLDVMPAGILDSPIFDRADAETGIISICSRVDLMGDNSTSVNFHAQQIFIEIDLTASFSVMTIEMGESNVGITVNATLDYEVSACQCNEAFECVEEALEPGSEAIICVETNATSVEIAEIRQLEWTLGSLAQKAVTDGVEEDFSVVSLFGSKAVIRTKLLSAFFESNNTAEYVEAQGTCSLLFVDSDEMIGESQRRGLRATISSRRMSQAVANEANFGVSIEFDTSAEAISSARTFGMALSVLAVASTSLFI